jgi:VIT1/CCC1 family predicted Fe2+/Mn2+ transporter
LKSVEEPGCVGFAAVRAELALGALTGRERAEALAHLEHCLACREKVRRLITRGEKLLELLPAAEPPPGFERRVLKQLRLAPPGAEVPGGCWIISHVSEEAGEQGRAVRLAALAAGWSHRHRDVSGGWLRPTVFGAVDGLVTNASLIAGLGGGGAAAHTVVLTGVASLVAGAFSMGTGEYISVTNQNELVGAEVAVERRMHARFPAAEEAELTETFRGYGADPDTAAAMAAAVSADPDTALRFHAREELGVDPLELPSPLLAGASSLAAFSSGALIPLLPYLFGLHSLATALAITAAALLAGGMTVGRLTGRPVLRSGLRQLALGAVAVAVTFAVGSLIGAQVH